METVRGTWRGSPSREIRERQLPVCRVASCHAKFDLAAANEPPSHHRLRLALSFYLQPLVCLCTMHRLVSTLWAHNRSTYKQLMPAATTTSTMSLVQKDSTTGLGMHWVYSYSCLLVPCLWHFTHGRKDVRLMSAVGFRTQPL